jgi:secreted protein with Ig-like and vWFA domain
MNGDDLKPGTQALPPEDGWEARLTARLLGELSEAESKALDQVLAADPQLAQLEQRLRQTIGYVREVAADPAGPALGATPLPRMSPGRRERLLEQLRSNRGSPADTAASEEMNSGAAVKTVIPVDFPTEQGPPATVPVRGGSWLALAACLVGLLLAAALFLDLQPRMQARMASSSSMEVAREGKPGPASSLERFVRESSASPAGAPIDRLNLPVDGFANGLVNAMSPNADRPEARFGKGVSADALVRDRSQAATPVAPSSAAPPPGIRAEMMQPELLRRYGLAPAQGGASRPVTTARSTSLSSRLTEAEVVSGPSRVGGAVNAPAPAEPRGEVLESRPLGNDLLTDRSAGSIPGGETPPSTAGGTPAATEGRFTEDRFGGGDSGGGGGAGEAAVTTFDFAPAMPNRAEVQLQRRSLAEKAEGGDVGSLSDSPSVNLLLGVSPRDAAISDSQPLAYEVIRAPSNGRLEGTAAGAAPSTRQQADDSRTHPKAVADLDATNFSDPTDEPTLGRALNRAIEDQDKAMAAEAKSNLAFFSLQETPAIRAASDSSEALVEEQGAKSPLSPLAEGTMLDRSKSKSDDKPVALAPVVVAPPAPVPQPEVASEDNPVSTFSLNVSDVSFKLAGASLDNGQLPGPSTVRTEEFLNAFHYRDPDPAPGRPVAFAWERAQFPFAQQRDVVRLSVRTGAMGREANRPLNVVLLLDSSGSMERADRVSTIREALKVLGNQMMPQDRVSVVSFARTARLWIDGLPGDQASNLAERVGELAPEGGTHLEEALRVGYDTARKHFTPEGVNRVVLLTDGAANLGELRAEALREMVESNRKRGVALDCFGIGFDGYQDDLLEALSRNGDGRYGFVNSPEEAATGFANQLAGALKVAAADVKVQVEFNPQRVQRWRQIGYAKHQLTQEQFRDNTVDAAEIGAAESGTALYVIEPNARGTGPIGTVRVRFRDPASGQYSEQEWAVPYEGPALPLEQSSPALRLATAAAAFGEMLSASPYASEVSNDRLIALLNGVPENYSPDPRPERLLNMVRQAQSILGR